MRTHESRRVDAGFTLVELMVALVLSLLLVVAMMKMQGSLAQQTVRNADAGVRDNEARVAMSTLSQDLSGSGFLLGGSQQQCHELFAYNSATTGNFFTHHPVDAVVASTGLTLPFAQGLTVDYPPAGVAIASDVLAITASANGSGFNNTTAQIVSATPSGFSPSSTGKLALQGAGLVDGDTGVVQVASNNRVACFRMPMHVSALPLFVQPIAGTQWFPSNAFNGFATPLATAGYPTFTDPVLGQSQIVDMTPTTTAVTYVYYIANNAPSYPLLMRSTYDLANDQLTLTPNSTIAIAAGVVSLQVYFGVDPGKTGSVTSYEKAATVTSSNHWDVVRTVAVAVVSRSLADDNDSKFQPASPLTVPMPAPFPTPLTIPATTPQRRHFLVNTVEIAERNTLWNCNGIVCAP